MPLIARSLPCQQNDDRAVLVRVVVVVARQWFPVRTMLSLPPQDRIEESNTERGVAIEEHGQKGSFAAAALALS